MPVSYRLPARLVGLGLLCTFTAAGVYGKVLEVQRARPYGRFNEVQILERAQAVSSQLLTQATSSHITTRRECFEYHDGTTHPLWYVDYANEINESILRLGFDGETGTLHLAALCPQKNALGFSRFAHPGRLDTASDVLKLSREWVYTLGLAPKMGPWEVTHNPERRGNVWRVVWECRGQSLNLSFDRSTGRMIMAQMHL